MEIKAEEASEAFDIDVKTGVLVWKNPNKHHKEKTGKVAGSIRESRGKSYWVIRWNSRTYRRAQLVYLMVNGHFPRPVVDHINGNSLDDRPENLRQASVRLNNRNHKRGASIRKLASGRYQARLSQMIIGTFDDKETAEAAYWSERTKLWNT